MGWLIWCGVIVIGVCSGIAQVNVGNHGLGISICLFWGVLGLFSAIAYSASLRRKKERAASEYQLNVHIPRSLRAIADEKRSYMFEMYRLYELKQRELAELKAHAGTEDSVEYQQKVAALQKEIDERKKYYNQAAEEYRIAEIDAP